MKRPARPRRAAAVPLPAGVPAGGADSFHIRGVVVAINAQLLEVLTQGARQASPVFPLPPRQRERFAQLTPESCERIAHCSVLLVEAGFTDHQRWTAACGHASIATEAGSSIPWLSAAEGVALAQTTLLLAWHVCQTQVAAASVLLGMSPAVAALMAKRPVRDLTRLAREHSDWILPRWSDQPDIWDSLLDLSARVAYEDPICLSTRGLQLSGRQMQGAQTTVR